MLARCLLSIGYALLIDGALDFILQALHYNASKSKLNDTGTSFETVTSFCIIGGGGGTQIWFRRGCAAEAAKPVPIFKGHFGGKGYPLLGVSIQENDVFVYFSDEMGENI